jgi:hypothetical protein
MARFHIGEALDVMAEEAAQALNQRLNSAGGRKPSHQRQHCRLR